MSDPVLRLANDRQLDAPPPAELTNAPQDTSKMTLLQAMKPDHRPYAVPISVGSGTKIGNEEIHGRTFRDRANDASRMGAIAFTFVRPMRTNEIT